MHPSTNDPPRGVMDAGYARGRALRPHLRFRYRVRARVAVEAYLETSLEASPETAREGPAPRVLDLGCAEGRTLLEISRLLGEGVYDGVDLSRDLIASAPSLPPGVTLHHGDVCALSEILPDGSYSLVTALAVLEHLPRPEACVEQAWRKLEPGGLFVATCPAPAWDRLAGALGLVQDEHHEQQLDAGRMAEMARACGFETVFTRRFMWAPVGFLPYLRVPVGPAFSLRLDRAVRALRAFDFLFVNQALFARKGARRPQQPPAPERGR